MRRRSLGRVAHPWGLSTASTIWSYVTIKAFLACQYISLKGVAFSA